MLWNDAQEQTLLLLLLKLESEGGLDAAPLIKEASAHVDVGDVSEQPAHEVDARMEDDVRPELLVIIGPRPVALLPRLELTVDDVVGGGGGADSQYGDTDPNREGHALPDVGPKVWVNVFNSCILPRNWEKQVYEENAEN